MSLSLYDLKIGKRLEMCGGQFIRLQFYGNVGKGVILRAHATG